MQATLTRNDKQEVLFMTIIKEKGLQTYILQNGWGLCEVSWCKEFGTIIGYYSKYDAHFKSVADKVTMKPNCYSPFSEGASTGRTELDLHIQNAQNQLENLLNLTK